MKKIIIDLYVNKSLTLHEVYLELRKTHSSISKRKVVEIIKESGLLRKQGKCSKNRKRQYSKIQCEACSDLFIPGSSRQTHCNDCSGKRKLNAHLKCSYGIDRKQYEHLLKIQNYACAICGMPFIEQAESKHRVTRVDHDHKTFKVRGVLCNGCNTRLSGLEDDEWMNKALFYLQKT